MPSKKSQQPEPQPEKLTWAQVSSWRLRRQYLVEPAHRDDLLEVTSRVCGLHAQVMSSTEIQAALRRAGGTLEDLRTALWEDHSLVKTWAMRGTLHLLSADEMPLYVKALRTRQGYRKGAWLKAFDTSIAEIDSIIEGVREALDGRCLTRQELAAEVARVTGKPGLAQRLRSGWGEFLKPAAFMGYLSFGPSQGQNVTFVRPDQWIGAKRWPEPDEAESREALLELFRRFMATYGPATREDFARWFGVSSARDVFLQAQSELVPVEVEGYKAWALASCLAEMQAEPEPSPHVRLLGGFDPYIVGLSTPQRPSLMPEASIPRVYRTSGWLSPVVLVDGKVCGVWNYTRSRTELGITIELFEEAGPRVKKEIEAEAERVTELLGGPLELAYDTVAFGG